MQFGAGWRRTWDRLVETSRDQLAVWARVQDRDLGPRRAWERMGVGARPAEQGGEKGVSGLTCGECWGRSGGEKGRKHPLWG